jgi:hypothetical protein
MLPQTANLRTTAFVSTYDMSPVISGVSPNNLIIGVQTNVQISGSHFGTNMPQVSLSLPGSSIVVQYNNDTTINALVTAGSAGVGTIQVTAEGYGGQGFLGTGGQSQQSQPSPPVSATLPPVYTVVMREFIRGNYVAGPFNCFPGVYLNGPIGHPTYFRGDSRNFMANPPPENPPSNPYRAMQTVVVQPESAVSSSGVGGTSAGLSGTTREYDSTPLIAGSDPAGSGQIIDPAIPDAVVRCRGGAVEIGVATASAPAAPTPTRQNAHAVSVVFTGKSLNPITPASLTPAISWTITVTVDHTDPNAVRVSASGSHTCYPAAEIWVTSSANPGAPYYVWEYGPGGQTPNVAYDESTTYLSDCLFGFNPAITVNGSTTLPQ